MSWCASLWNHFILDSLCFLIWISVSFFRVRKFSVINSSNTFCPLSFLNPYNVNNISKCKVVPKNFSFELFSILFSSSFSDCVISVILSSRSLIYPSVLLSMLFIPQLCFLFQWHSSALSHSFLPIPILVKFQCFCVLLLV